MSSQTEQTALALLDELVGCVDGIIEYSDGVPIKVSTGMLKRKGNLVLWPELTTTCWLGCLPRARRFIQKQVESGNFVANFVADEPNNE